MLKEHINDINTRWAPKERRGSAYDPQIFLETPEQARKLLTHLQSQLAVAKRDKNRELILELSEILARVESLSKRFFRWEQSLDQNAGENDLREIRKLPLNF